MLTSVRKTCKSTYKCFLPHLKKSDCARLPTRRENTVRRFFSFIFIVNRLYFVHDAGDDTTILSVT